MRTGSLLAGLATSLAVAAASLGPTPVGADASPMTLDSASASTARSAVVARSSWRPDAAVRDIVVTRTRVFIAGDFRRLTNPATHHRVSRSHVAAFNRSTGALIPGFSARVNGPVRDLATFKGKLVLGGDFTRVNGRNRRHLAALKLGTGRLTGWRAQVNGPVLALLSLGRSVYVGGNFNRVNGVTRSKLFALNKSAKLRPDWPQQGVGFTNRGVFALAASANRHSIVVGGGFQSLDGSARAYLGEIARGSGRVRAWHPAPACLKQCFVSDLAVSRRLVYAGIQGTGGHVTAYRGRNATTRWSHRTNGDVDVVTLSGRHLLIGGHFTTVARRPHELFAQLVAATGAVTRRRPPTAGPTFPGVLAIDVHDGLARVGGDFASLAHQRRYAVLAD